MCIVITAGVSYFDFTLIGVYLCIASVYLRICECIFMHRECIFMHRECIFTHSRVYIYAFASVYLCIRESIFTHSRVYIYATSVFIHHRRTFTPFWCEY